MRGKQPGAFPTGQYGESIGSTNMSGSTMCSHAGWRCCCDEGSQQSQTILAFATVKAEMKARAGSQPRTAALMAALHD
jgi:hypothetical protein